MSASVQDYRDNVAALRDAITSFRSTPKHERSVEVKRLVAWWKRVANDPEPKRLSDADREKALRAMRDAAQLIDNQSVEEAANAGRQLIQ